MVGPIVPALVSPNVLNVLVDSFNIQANSAVEADMSTLNAVA